MTTLMKTLSILTLTFSLLAASKGKATEDSAPEKMDAATQVEIHEYLCTGPQTEALKDQEVKEMRTSLLKFLISPAQAAKELLDQGNRNDVGPFALLATCAMVTGLEDVLTEKGCAADDGKTVEAKPALELCKSMLTQLAK